MEELTLNFFGEEAKIIAPKDIESLRSIISQKYLLSVSDANEIILYYIIGKQKIYIQNKNDFCKFKESNNKTIYLDVNQNSKLYIDNASLINEDKIQTEKDKQELKDLLEKYKDFNEKKKEKERYYYNKQNEIMKEIKERRAKFIKKQHIEMAKVYEEDEEYITKIYNLQRKLSLPTTVRIPKEIKKQEEERIYQENKKKQEEIRKQAKIKQKEREEQKKKYFEKIKKLREEDEKKKEIERLNHLRSTQKQLNSKKDFFPHLSLRKMEEEKRKAIFRCRTIAAATAASFISSKKMENNKINEDKKELILSNEIIEKKEVLKTVPVFTKVNDILGQTVNQIEKAAKDHISSQSIKEEKEKEKIALIQKIKNITKEAVKEINNLTKMVIEQSNELIKKINNNELSSLTDINDLDHIILKTENKDIKKKKEGIHFHVSCDGCKVKPIRGNRYKCKECPDFDFCEKCYEKEKEKHGHEFKKIEKPSNTKRMGHKKKDYCSRGISHKDIRCENCGLEPLTGWRFKCSICEDYNLCENCEEAIGFKHNHPLIKIYYSAMQKVFDDNYLKMNNYS